MSARGSRGPYALTTRAAPLLLLAACRQIAGIDHLEEADRLGKLEQEPCESSAACIRDFGEYTVCRARDRRCVPLFSDDCDVVSGNYAAEDALILGSIEPVTGLDSATGRNIRVGIMLAVTDFDVNKGLPPADGRKARRPVAVVHCNDDGESSTALSAARHLSIGLGVPAIIGTSFSGVTLDVATEVTIPRGTLLMSPSATSVAITELADDGLVWRTAPSDAVQARAQVLAIERVATNLRTERSVDVDATKLRLAVLHKGDAYGYGLADDVLSLLRWNDRSALDRQNARFVTRLDYGDPSQSEDATLRITQAVAGTLAALPDVVVLYGTSEVATDLLVPIEQAWPEDRVRPHYVLADGGRIEELQRAIDALDADGALLLARRIVGTEPGSLSAENAQFRARYAAAADDPEQPAGFGTANAYDAVYLLAYAASKAGSVSPTGAELAAALTDILPLAAEEPTRVRVGAASVNGTLRAIANGERVLIAGASGPLSFDRDTGDVLSDILFWCPQADGDGVTLAPSGEHYDVVNESIALDADVSACNW